MYQYARLKRVRYDFLLQPIPVVAVGTFDVIAESMFVNIGDRALQVTLLFMKEGLPIGDQELHIANLRPIDGGVVNFVQNAMRQREPDPTPGRIGRSHALFGARSPARGNSRASKSHFTLLGHVLLHSILRVCNRSNSYPERAPGTL